MKCQIKNTLTEVKNASEGHISTPDTVEERLSKLENISKELSQTDKQREKDWRKKKKRENTKEY